ncbi:hypothetical protein K1719_012828 [Acacia pycnantha]|nr:hypothetical protein K1719_012828 [Acacia pycnantha]
MCVELDLTKPLVPEFEVEGQVFSVVYESLGMLCNNCGFFGHSKGGCEDFQKRKGEQGIEVDQSGEDRRTEGDGEGKKELWKTMQRPRRQQRTNVVAQKFQSGSRFSVLEEAVEVEGQQESNEVFGEGVVADKNQRVMQGERSEQKVARAGPVRFDRVRKMEKGETACASGSLSSQMRLGSKLHPNRNKGVELIEKENMDPGEMNRKGNTMML